MVSLGRVWLLLGGDRQQPEGRSGRLIELGRFHLKRLHLNRSETCLTTCSDWRPWGYSASDPRWRPGLQAGTETSTQPPRNTMEGRTGWAVNGPHTLHFLGFAVNSWQSLLSETSGMVAVQNFLRESLSGSGWAAGRTEPGNRTASPGYRAEC